ncbi:MAG: S8 family serine peptidase [Saprospiraceae bacterium]
MRLTLTVLPLFVLQSLTLYGQNPWLAKCAPALLTESRSAAAGPERFVVVTRNLSSFRNWLTVVSPEIIVLGTYEPAEIAVLWCPRTVLMEKILPMSDVQFADIGHTVAREERAVPGHNLATNSVSFVHGRQPALDGSGTTVSIKEFRFDSTDADLKNRVLSTGKSATGLTVHAGLMATLAAGAGNTDPEARGVARGSRLVSSSFVGLLPDADSDYTDFDIAIQNHSYGVDIENYYGAGALAYDLSTQNHGELLHVFSSGNKGFDTAPAGPYAATPGFANLTGNFKMTKNALCVAATDSFANVLAFSSRGPAYDGRIKPDLTAFGQNGSSESATLVSGAAAVLRQAFFEKNNQKPPAEMLRAVLIGSCDDIGNPGPDFLSGHGNLNLKLAVEIVQRKQTATGAIAEGETKLFPITLPANPARLRVTLCWNDVPAQPNAAKALAHDLDLRVVAPDGTVWLPWVLNPSPHRDSLLLPARRGRDSLNTAEQVRIDAPSAGTYQLQVRGAAVASGSQIFALVFHWDTIGHFEWTSPVRNHPVAAGAGAVLRWETNFEGQRGILEWKTAGSNTWQTIDPDLSLDPGYYRWLAPDTLAAAQVRMRTGGGTVVSDTFLIAPKLRVRVDFNCPDSLMLRWNSVSPAAVYRVWALSQQYLEPSFLTADTSVVLQKSAFAQERFAVSALLADAMAEGHTASTPDLRQTTGCYILNLLALLDDVQDRIHLTLDLSSLYGVQRVFLEKLKGGLWSPLHIEDPTALQVTDTDHSPTAGTNTYRARLEMENGGQIIGDPVVVYHAGPGGYLVLPNPARTGQTVAVLARALADTPQFFLYDALGRLVLEKELEGTRTDVELPGLLAPGVYMWTVAGLSGDRFGQGKLLVR